MAVNSHFKSVLRTVVGKRTVGEVVESTGISTAYVHNMLAQGRVPSPEKLAQLSDGLNLTPEDRERVFEAAGYGRLLHRPVPERDPRRRVVPVDHLTPEQEEIVRRLIEDPERVNALGLLLDPRVMETLALGAQPAGVGV